MQDCCIVLNPEARTARRWQVASKLDRVAKGAAVRVTSAPGQAERMAREAVEQGFRTVVAAGGDGTINEVLRGIAGADVRLGVLPLGTMNVFAREHSIPLQWEAAWERILKGTERRVDVGRANKMPLAQLAGVGFDARAIARVNPRLKRGFGPLSYVWAGLCELGSPLPKLRVVAEGHAPMECVWVLVSMGRYYGGPFSVFPGTSSGNGFIKILVINKLDVNTLVRFCAAFPFGWHTELEGMRYFQTKNLRVEAVGDTGGAPNLELDGELMGSTPVEFTIDPLSLRVVV